MSYDFRIVEAKDHRLPPCMCGREHGYFSIDLGDPTYNIGGMFHEACGKDADGNDWFQQHREVPVREALAMWRRAHEDMTTRYDHYKAMNPENGWGSVDGAIRKAEECIRALTDVLERVEVEVDDWQKIEDDYIPEEKRPKRRVHVDRMVFVP